MEFLQSLANNSQFPIITAFLLGLMTSISPCPLATNISALGYISKDIQDKKKTFYNGLLYMLGRAISYTILGIILIYFLKEGASIYKIQKFISVYGAMIIGPLLIIMGLFMLDYIKLGFLPKINIKLKNGEGKKCTYWNSLFLGIVFALAFCPYSGILFFGGLIPLSVSSTSGYFLPLIFAIGTGLPVIIFAWILAYSIASVGAFYNKIKTFEKWFRRVVAVLFIVVGLYYCYIIFF
ncbi:MAG: aromatic aminobenezylarsenical efflux permease ArsG family transporter [Bacteroidales bacterium]